MNEAHQNRPFKCAKCGHNEFEAGQLRAAGGFWTKLFDIQNLKFITQSCQNCGYTEIYKKGTGKAENIVDFITN